MFSVNHILWMLICVLLTAGALFFLKKYRPSLKQVLNIACAVCILSELVKVFGTVELIPSADGSMLYPYLEMKHVPLHLCSVQILLIFYVRFAKNSTLRTALLAFMYPTCTLGAFFAILLPSIFPETVAVSEAFTHPLAYQTFLYHVMLLVLGIDIFRTIRDQIIPKHYVSTLLMVVCFGFLSVYFNSIFASPVYVNGKLQSVEFTTNFFFTYKPPIPVTLRTEGQWFLYLGILAVLAVVLIGVLYIPVFRRARKQA